MLKNVSKKAFASFFVFCFIVKNSGKSKKVFPLFLKYKWFINLNY